MNDAYSSRGAGDESCAFVGLSGPNGSSFRMHPSGGTCDVSSPVGLTSQNFLLHLTERKRALLELSSSSALRTGDWHIPLAS